jgi:hypothetical protein
LSIEELKVERPLIPLVELVVFAGCWAQPLLTGEALCAATKREFELNAFGLLEVRLRFGIGTRAHIRRR